MTNEDIAFIGLQQKVRELEAELEILRAEKNQAGSKSGNSQTGEIARSDLAYDIILRKQAKDELRESENRYQALIHNTMDGFWVVDMKGRFMEVNDAYCAMTGYTREALLSMSIVDVEYEETPEQTRERLRQLNASGFGRFESRHRRADGTVFHVEVKTVALSDKAIFLVFIRDISKRKRAEKAPELSHKQWEATFNAIDDMVMLVDKNHNIIETNSAMKREFPHLEEIAGSLKCNSVIHGADSPPPECISCDVFRTGEAAKFEVMLKHLRNKWFEFQIYPVKDEAGDATQLVHIMSDITERKRTEDALKESEERYRRLSEDMPIYVCAFRPDGKLTYANAALAEMAGFSSAEMVKRNFFDMLPPDIQELVRERLETLSPEQPSETHEEIFTAPDGEKRWQQWINRAFFDDKGRTVRLQAIGMDITERKRTEEALRESEERYRTLSTNLPIGIYRNTPGKYGHFLAVNPALARMHGFDSPEETIALPIATLYANPDERETFSQMLIEHGEVQNHELLLKRKDESTFWGAVSARVVRDENNNILHFDGILRDITVRKRVEEALKESEEKFYKAFHSSPVAKSISKLNEGRFIDVNDEFLRLAQRPREKVIGRTAMDLGIWADPEKRYQFLDSLKSGQTIRNIETSIKRKNRETLYVSLSAEIAVLKGEYYLFVSALDITQQKRAQRERMLLKGISDLFLLSFKDKDKDKDKDKRIASGLVKYLSEGFGYPIAAMGLCNEERKEIVFLAAHGIDFESEESKRVCIADSICGKTALTGVSLFSADFGRGKNGGGGFFKGLGIKTLICAPLISGENAMGVVFIADRIKRPEDAHLEETLSSIGNRIALEMMRIRHEGELQLLSRKVIQMQEDERTSVSRELHDDLGQQLSALALELEWIMQKPGGKKKHMEEMLRKLKITVGHLRQICRGLRPPILDDMGIAVAINNLIEEYESRHQIRITREIAIDAREELSSEKAITVYRVLQESLNNAVRHSKAGNIVVKLRYEDNNLVLEVKDNGKGFVPEQAMAGRFGIVGMKERAAMLNGRFKISSAPGKGTEVLMHVPRG